MIPSERMREVFIAVNESGERARALLINRALEARERRDLISKAGPYTPREMKWPVNINPIYEHRRTAMADLGYPSLGGIQTVSGIMEPRMVVLRREGERIFRDARTLRPSVFQVRHYPSYGDYRITENIDQLDEDIVLHSRIEFDFCHEVDVLLLRVMQNN